MKQDMDKLNLRGAFRPEPQSCHDALMAAARSVKEEPPMKKASLRTVLIAAAIILATMAAAVAAGSLLGWTDYLGRQYGISVPQTAQRILGEAWNTHSFTLGPVTFTTRELLCDGHIAMASTEIAMTDENGNALLCADPFDAVGAVGNGRELAQRLGLDPGTPWLEAAQQLGRKLYNVRAILELPAEIDCGPAMEDTLWGQDGQMSYFSMAFPEEALTGEKLDVQLFLRVAEMDVETGEEKEVLTSREPLSLYLEAAIDACEYRCADAFTAGGYRLEGVRAELTPAGLYLAATFTAPDGITEEDVWEICPTWLDENGQPLPMGLSLSANVDAHSLPMVVYTEMFSVDTLPDRLTLRVETANGPQEATLTK